MTQLSHSGFSNQKITYLDNAATSWPKPPGVAAAMVNFLEHTGANPGRSGHRLSVEAARIVYQTRESICQLFNAPDPMRVTFGLNITEALNLALHGLLKSGDHVITSGIEHNSVMRPLRALEKRGVQVTVIPCLTNGLLNPDDIEMAVQPNTRIIIINHASNVIGTIQPLKPISRIAMRHELLLVADTAQTAGAYSIDMQAEGIDLLAFTGHKSLYGPMGTGGLIIGSRVDIRSFSPLKQGGTGSRSEHETQPNFLPDAYESGTPNAVGLAGLSAAINWLQQTGVQSVRDHEMRLCQQLIDGLMNTRNVQVYGTLDTQKQTGTLSINIQGLEPSIVGLMLDEDFTILTRVGLHCSPAAHNTIGTFPTGTVRLSIGAFNTQKEIDLTLAAISSIAKQSKHGQ